MNVNDNDKDNDNENENEYENYDDYKIKQLNYYFKMIGETKSFEEQINLFKKNRLFKWVLEYEML